MRWYEGNIAEAVTLSRKNNAIFVVYVEGDDDKSKALLDAIENREVATILETQSFVVIKIKANSVSYQQFSEIYKQVPVPSLYFIGKSGAPIEIIVGSQGVADLLVKVRAILQKHGVQLPSQTNAAMSSNFLEAEKKDDDEIVSKLPPKPSTSKVDDVAPGEPTITENTNEVPTEDKIQHAKDLIEKKREAKKIEDEEKERKLEIERRKAGQSTQNFKKWQQEQEFKQHMEQREKEKKEEQAARQRILAQIEMDKADRATRFSPNQNAGNTKLPSPQPSRRNPTNANSARLQFKLPNGSSTTEEFSSTSTLLDVQTYISNNLNLNFSYVLSTTFPRREFSNADNSRTMLDLELVPTAVILILPLSHGTVSTNSGNFATSLLWTLMAPFFNIYGYLKNLIYGPPPPSTPSTSRNHNKRRSAESTGETSRIPKRKPNDSSTVVRRQGNVHRLGDRTDSEDENNTWNGNSTQQM